VNGTEYEFADNFTQEYEAQPPQIIGE
jgi:hypothetical protein